MNDYPARDLSSLNTLAIPSRAEHFAAASSEAEIQAACAWAREQGVRVLVLGGGSNVIPADRVSALVLKPELRGISLTRTDGRDILVDVGAGENWHQLVLHTLERGWYGLENLALIPGSAGAAPIQNIGAYGVELSQVFDSLRAVHIGTGQVKEFSLDDCAFGYRDSVFKNSLRGQYVITRVRLRLSLEPRVNLSYPALAQALGHINPAQITPQQVCSAVCDVRRRKLPDPAQTPNAGSFFKNPVVDEQSYQRLQHRYPDLVAFTVSDGKKLAAAWLIERAGWKGRDYSGVCVHTEQSLVLTNPRKCSSDAVLAAAAAIQHDVETQFGVRLEIEPQSLA